MIDSLGAHSTMLLPGKKMQLGFVVPDMEEALRFWTEKMKVGPFVLIEEPLGDRQFVHRGEVSPVDMSIALSYVGDTQIELIAQKNSAASPYTEFLAQGREGLHHVAYLTASFDQACVDFGERGFREVSSIRLADGTRSVSYFEAPTQLGVMFELVPVTETKLAYYGAIRGLVEGWKGQPCVYRFKTQAELLASEICRPCGA